MLYKMSEWEVNERWYVGNTDDLVKGSNRWWLPARMLNMPIEEYILMLVNKYHAGHLKFYDYGEKDKRGSLLIYSFDKYKDAHRFLLDMNREARNKKFKI